MTNPAEARLLRSRRVPAEGRDAVSSPASDAFVRPLGAVGAGAGEHDLVLLDGVAEPARDAVDRALEPRVAERLDLAAVAADRW